jgi:hypothetical protein
VPEGGAGKLTRPQITGTLELPSTQEELAEGLAASALGSSKHYRLGYRGHPNEDRVFLRRTAWQEDGALVHALFVGVFDGHGGCARVCGAGRLGAC